MDNAYDIPLSLVARVLSGDEDAIQELTDRVLLFADSVAQSLVKRIGLWNDQIADDLVMDAVSDTVLAIRYLLLPVDQRTEADKEYAGGKRLRRGAARRDPRSIKNWNAFVHTIVHCRFIDRFRVFVRRRNIEVGADGLGDDEHGGSVLDWTPCWGDQVGRVLRGEVEALLEQRPKEDAEMFRLYMQGYTGKELAERYDCTCNAVHIRIHRVKKFLMQHMAENTGPGDAGEATRREAE